MPRILGVVYAVLALAATGYFVYAVFDAFLVTMSGVRWRPSGSSLVCHVWSPPFFGGLRCTSFASQGSRSPATGSCLR
jgi:hypothetical protein